MALHPLNDRLKERILVMGGPGSGKTFGFYKIAQFAQQTGSEARFWVIDTDNASDRMLATEFSDLTNVMPVHLAFDWEALVDGLKEVSAKSGPQDWTMIDMVGAGWGMVEEYYIDQVHHQDVSSFFLSARQANTSGNPLDGWKDWGVINKLWRQEVGNRVLRWPGHLYCTTPVAAIGDQDPKEIKALFGRLGVKPKGQKDMAHLFHTVLQSLILGTDQYLLSTGKDRGRPIMQAEPVSNFPVNYLVAKGGWRP